MDAHQFLRFYKNHGHLPPEYDVNYQKDRHEPTLLMAALFYDELTIFKKILTIKDLNLNTTSRCSWGTFNYFDGLEYTVLVIAIREKKIPFLMELLKYCDQTTINYQCSYGWTALMYSAINYTNPEILQKLLKTNGIDINIRGSDGKTALSIAISNNNVNMVRELFKQPNLNLNNINNINIAIKNCTKSEIILLFYEKECIKVQLYEKEYINLLFHHFGFPNIIINQILGYI